jgi:hypothetical protein
MARRIKLSRAVATVLRVILSLSGLGRGISAVAGSKTESQPSPSFSIPAYHS